MNSLTVGEPGKATPPDIKPRGAKLPPEQGNRAAMQLPQIGHPAVGIRRLPRMR